jgi:hypothetical protein
MINNKYLIITFILIGIIFVGSTSAHVQLKERIAFSQESGRDPFSLPSGVYLLSKTKIAPVTNALSHPQRVKVILISDYIRLALIDRYIVTVGDSINGEKVLEIKPNQVILGKGNKKRALPLYQSPIPLKVEEK